MITNRVPKKKGEGFPYARFPPKSQVAFVSGAFIVFEDWWVDSGRIFSILPLIRHARQFVSLLSE